MQEMWVTQCEQTSLEIDLYKIYNVIFACEKNSNLMFFLRFLECKKTRKC